LLIRQLASGKACIWNFGLGWVGPLVQGNDDMIDACFVSLPLNRVSRARETILALQQASLAGKV
jgi:hypothetical protein